MKHSLLALLVVACATVSFAAAPEIRLGDSLETVIAALGEPIGELHVGSRSLMYFERGNVEFRDGKVVGARLVSPEEAAARREERIRLAQDAREAAEEARARRVVEGTALRDKKLADPVFMASSATARAAFWEAFREDYPEVALPTEYDAAIRERRAEQAAARAEAERELAMAQLLQAPAEVEPSGVYVEESAAPVYVSYAAYPYAVWYGGYDEPRRHRPRYRCERDDTDRHDDGFNRIRFKTVEFNRIEREPLTKEVPFHARWP